MKSKKLIAVTAMSFALTLAPLTVFAAADDPEANLIMAEAAVSDTSIQTEASRSYSNFGPINLGAMGSDLGDAPTTCKWGGMSAYGAGIIANFPTIFGNPACPNGILHHKPMYWLGLNSSHESDADTDPGSDGRSNIDMPANQPNRDGFDDGVLNPATQLNLALPECGTATFKYMVTRTAGKKVTLRFNAWFDLTRDGDWADSIKCKLPSGATQTVSERAVTNQAVVLPACPTGTCTTIITTPAFKTANLMTNANAKEIWMRASLTDIPVVAANKDGSGPLIGYNFGETEDYHLVATAFDGKTWTFVNSLGEEGEPQH